MTAVTIGSDFGAQENKVCHCFHCFSIYLPWSDGTGCKALVQFFNIFKAITLFVLRRTAMPTPPMDLASTVEWIWAPSRLNLWAYLPSPHHPVCSTRQGLAQGSTAPLYPQYPTQWPLLCKCPSEPAHPCFMCLPSEHPLMEGKGLVTSSSLGSL